MSSPHIVLVDKMTRKSSRVTPGKPGATRQSVNQPSVNHEIFPLQAVAAPSGAAPVSVGANRVAAVNLLGDGPAPPHGIAPGMLLRDKFSGKKDDFPVFVVTFKTQLRLLGLHKVLDEDTPDIDQNTRVFDELVLSLDKASIKLICNSTVNDGKKSFQLLEQKYKGNELAQKANAINELMHLVRKPGESLDQLEARVDSMKKTLDHYKVLNDDAVIVCAYAKVLPPIFQTLKTVIFHGKIPTYDQFKADLHNHISYTNIIEQPNGAPTVMTVQTGDDMYVANNNNAKNKKHWRDNKCKLCFKSGHYASQCRSTMYCIKCNNKNHNTKNCRRGAGGRGEF